MIQRVFAVVGLVALFIVGGCAPKTFVRTMDPNWATVEIRSDLAYDQAWEDVVDLLVRRFDLEIISKDSGYVRTGWLHTWTGKMNERYRVRATVKFTDANRRVDLKSEAHYLDPTSESWIIGTDTLLLKTLKTDIMGAVSRTTR